MITCKFEDGGTGTLRHVVVDALVIKEGKILLVRRASHLLEGGKLCLPGGYLDRNETTIEGVMREVKEETGYEGVSAILFQLNDNPDRKNDDRKNVSFIYIIEVNEQSHQYDNEVTELKWFSLHELPEEKEVAFDHFETIMLYKKYYTQPFGLPIVGSQIPQ